MGPIFSLVRGSKSPQERTTTGTGPRRRTQNKDRTSTTMRSAGTRRLRIWPSNRRVSVMCPSTGPAPTRTKAAEQGSPAALLCTTSKDARELQLALISSYWNPTRKI
ncbi:unnamed protein product [Phaeothamnion confervicola]